MRVRTRTGTNPDLEARESALYLKEFYSVTKKPTLVGLYGKGTGRAKVRLALRSFTLLLNPTLVGLYGKATRV